jgi:hypothetical protein
LSPEAGGLAKLTITADNIVTTGGGGNGGNDPVYELEWSREDKDIRSHPKFQTGGTYALTQADRDAVKDWFTNGGPRPTGANPSQLVSRLDKGVSSYPVGIPVARSTTYTITRPVSSGAWVRGTPPALCGAPATNPQTGKAGRADPVASCLERGHQRRGECPDTGGVWWGLDRGKPVLEQCDGLRLVAGPWTQMYLDEVEGFPDAATCDLVDATSGAWAYLEARPMAGAAPIHLTKPKMHPGPDIHPEMRGEDAPKPRRYTAG